MPLVTPTAELSEAHLTRAEALVAAELNLMSLAEQEYVQQGSVGSSGTINLARPASSVVALTLTNMPAGWIVASPVTLSLGAVLAGSTTWGAGPTRVAFAVRFVGGWTADSLPEQIRQAVLTTATALAASSGREGVTSEQMGPVKNTYSDTAQAGNLPADALALLRPWLPLRF